MYNVYLNFESRWTLFIHQRHHSRTWVTNKVKGDLLTLLLLVELFWSFPVAEPSAVPLWVSSRFRGCVDSAWLGLDVISPAAALCIMSGVVTPDSSGSLPLQLSTTTWLGSISLTKELMKPLFTKDASQSQGFKFPTMINENYCKNFDKSDCQQFISLNKSLSPRSSELASV
jgi:hypothetical protein